MNYMSISSALKALREKDQCTQADRAQYFGIDASLIENWESGVAEPTISEGLTLNKLYGVHLEDLFADFDVKSIIPKECVASYEQKINTLKSLDRPLV